MLWYIELVLETALFARLCLWRDSRKFFQAFIGVDLLSGLLSLLGQRTHRFGFSAHVWWIATVVCVPLMALALEESVRLCRQHRLLLFWWIAFGFGCAWIRTFPYTNHVLLIGNSAAFAAWLWMDYETHRT